jgi:hypothetical protein
MADLLRALVYAWTLPNTVLGLVCGALSFQRYRRIGGVMVFDGPVKGFLAVLARFHRSAITFGHVVLSNRPVEGRLLAHELHHVWQYERLGPMYIPIYLVVWTFMGYRRHPFELSAKLAEVEAG